MKVNIQADLSKFRSIMHEVLRETKKEEVEFLNKRGVQVLIGSKGFPGAVNTTRKATAAQIRLDLGREYPAKDGRGGTKPVKLIYIKAAEALKNKGIGKGLSFAAWRAQVAQMAERIAKARDASRAYLAAGWLAAARDMGYLRRSDNNRSLRPVGTPGKKIGWGSKATTGSLVFMAYNNATSNSKTDEIIERGLSAAIQNQIADMRKYLSDRINGVFKKASAK